MKRIGICGHFGGNENFLDGQTIKTKILTDELIKIYGLDEIETIDTHGWKRSPIKLLIQCVSMIIGTENIIVLPAHNGVNVFIPLFGLMNFFFRRRLHYIVIGGWLFETLRHKLFLKKFVSIFYGVYVETNIMKSELESLGLKNLKCMTNFKKLEIASIEYDNIDIPRPFKACTFSRVVEKKGIEDAINVVKKINELSDRIIISLDIYGPIEHSYKEKFKVLQEKFPQYISYKGCIDYSKTVDTLKEYYVLLFPTRFYTEGVPGTIIDAYASGIPIIASRWKSAEEIIIHGKTGMIYEFTDICDFEEKLLFLINNPDVVKQMKANCFHLAKKFHSSIVISQFANHIR